MVRILMSKNDKTKSSEKQRINVVTKHQRLDEHYTGKNDECIKNQKQ